MIMSAATTPSYGVRARLTEQVEAALERLYDNGFLTGERAKVDIGPTKQASHGDFACPVALPLAKLARKKPRDIGEALQKELGDGGGMLDKTELAGPGFLNMFVRESVWRDALGAILETGADFIRSNEGEGKRVLIEFVSANPTGPLHIAHGRGAVVGDVVARLLDAAGYQVGREYYVNDLGHQVDTFARSIHIRYQELFDREVEKPEDFYPGDYVIEIAQDLREERGDELLDEPEEAWLAELTRIGLDAMLSRIKRDLAAFGITFDNFVSERTLTEEVGLHGILERLEKAGHIYEKDGKKWFRAESFGDDKDRVVVRDDGRTTYFASDIAYHDNKLQRGWSHLIDVLGADHGGYPARVRAGLAALGHEGDPLEVIFVQMVSLSRGGKPVRMGKRLGTAIWLEDVVAEAGRDATRYFFVMRRADAQFDFDLDLATSKSLDNPVFYAQMGHARMCAIARRAKEEGVAEPQMGPGALDALALPEELGIIRAMCRAPEVVAQAALEREPHQIVHYVQDLIGQFHSYYSQYKGSERVVSDDPAKTRARLLLCKGLQTTLAALLQDILGVGAPEEMYLDDPSNGEKEE